MAKEPPICKKCDQQHWLFLPCSTDRVYKRVGYDTIKKDRDYAQPKSAADGYNSLRRSSEYTTMKHKSNTRRIHYIEETRDGEG